MKLYELKFYNSPDNDFPGGKKVSMINPDDKYSVEGNTHGQFSHAIKHYEEFDSTTVIQVTNQIMQTLQKNPSINTTIKDKSGNVAYSGIDADKNLNHKMILNMLDLLNDKAESNQPLTAVEKQLLKLASPIVEKYTKLMFAYRENSIDIDNENKNNIIQLIKGGKILKFSATFNGNPVVYYLNFSNSGLVAEGKQGIFTLFKINKKGNNIQKIAKYILGGADIKNPELKKLLVNV